MWSLPFIFFLNSSMIAFLALILICGILLLNFLKNYIKFQQKYKP